MAKEILQQGLIMGNLTRNISDYELVCKCGDTECSVTILRYEPIIKVVQTCCDYFAQYNNVDRVILRINRAASCYVYNKSSKIGSNDNSQHPRCNAMDIAIFLPDGQQILPELVYQYLCDMHKGEYGIGNYKTFTHVDTRALHARWGYES